MNTTTEQAKALDDVLSCLGLHPNPEVTEEYIFAVVSGRYEDINTTINVLLDTRYAEFTITADHKGALRLTPSGRMLAAGVLARLALLRRIGDEAA